LLGWPISRFATKSYKIKRPLVYVIVLRVALAPCIGSEIAYAACTLDNIIVSIKDERRDTRLMDKMASGTLEREEGEKDPCFPTEQCIRGHLPYRDHGTM
jgi:hypothetical protein